jgi:hypothetical protein
MPSVLFRSSFSLLSGVCFRSSHTEQQTFRSRSLPPVFDICTISFRNLYFLTVCQVLLPL